MLNRILILIICNVIISQTNITTPMGSTGFGIWTTVNQAFKENETGRADLGKNNIKY